MTRSRRKTPIIGNTRAPSEKWWKTWANRIFRRREKQAIHHEEDPPEDPKMVTDEWDFSKDGKHRFDEDKYPEMMRK